MWLPSERQKLVRLRAIKAYMTKDPSFLEFAKALGYLKITPHSLGTI
jgi:hypothetical protein